VVGYDEFLLNLDHPRAAEIQRLAKHVENEFPALEREIKWNAPSFKVGDLNIVTFRLFPAPHLQVMLHYGSKKLPAGEDLTFEVTGLESRWPDKTRCQITISSQANAESESEFDALSTAIQNWAKLLRDRGLI
jgi:hypothetical protein